MKEMKNRKIRILIPFLAFVILITLGMSGLYADIFDSLGNVFENGNKEDILVVQKASAYSASSLSSAIKSVGTVNVLELTLGNDIKYSGKTLKASELSVGGSSTFYFDMNGHDLDVNNADEGGIFMEDSTFYAVDEVGGGNVDILSTYTGITCKNFVITSGTVSVDVGVAVPENYNPSGKSVSEGPFVPDGYEREHQEEAAKKLVSSENVDTEYLGATVFDNWEPGPTNGTAWNDSATDGIRVYGTVRIGNGSNKCVIWAHGAKYDGIYSQCNFGIQTVAAGLRIGDKDNLDDGTLIVDTEGGSLLSTGSMGIFSNRIHIKKGTVNAFGCSANVGRCTCGTILDCVDKCPSCGKDYSQNGFYPGIYFSDPWGFDGWFAIEAAGTVYASTRDDKCGILSFCCDHLTVRGTLYSGVRSASLDSAGNFTVTNENFNYKGIDHKPIKRQISAIVLDAGDFVVTGPNARCFLRGAGKTVTVGQEAGPKSWNGEKWYFNNIGSWFEWSLWTGDAGEVRARCNHSFITGRGVKPWIGVTLTNKFKKRTGTLSSLGLKNLPNRPGYDNKLNYMMTHCSAFEASNGAVMLVQSERSFDANDNKIAGDLSLGYEFSTALYCSGGYAGDTPCFQITGNNTNQTKVYLIADHYGIETEGASVRFHGNALVDIKLRYAPIRSDVPVCGIRTISKSYFTSSYLGGNFTMENGAVLQCDITARKNKIVVNPYSVGLDIGNEFTMKNGATARINVFPTTNYYKYCGIMAWNNTLIDSGSNLQVVAGGTAIRQERGKLDITGNNTYCNLVSYGGSYNVKNELKYGDNDISDWQVTPNSHYGVISAGVNCGYVKLSGNATVECSYLNSYKNAGGNNSYQAGIHADKNVAIWGNSTYKCTNASNGVVSYNEISILENANVEIENVKTGLLSALSGASPSTTEGTPFLKIKGKSTVYISADMDAVKAVYGINISGEVKVSLKSQWKNGGGSAMWVDKPASNTNVVTIDLEMSGFFSAYAPTADYAIGVGGNGNVQIGGSNGVGTVICEGNYAGIFTSGNINMDIKDGGEVNLYSASGYGATTAKNITISGSGNVTSMGKIYGLHAGKTSNGTVVADSNGKISITGTVKVEANGTYGGSASAISSVSFVNGSTVGASTSVKNPTVKKYNTLEELAQDLGGGFYATITNTYRKSVIAAIGAESQSTTDSFGVMNRMNPTGGPEEIWYFKYDSNIDMWTMQNYLTKQYMTLGGNGDKGTRITTTNKANDKNYFGIKKPQKIFEGYAASGTAINTPASENQYVIYSCFKGGLNLNGTYGSSGYGEFCFDLPGNVGTGATGEYGTQIYDNMNIRLWNNYDAQSTPGANSNQVFSINPIVDLGDLFETTIKSGKNGKYLDFVKSEEIAWKEKEQAPSFAFEKDLTGRFPLSYEIYEGSLRMDLSGAGTGRQNSITAWHDDHNEIAHRFRILYNIGSEAAGYRLMPIKTPWVVYVESNGAMNTNYNACVSSSTFIFESYGNDAAKNAFDLQKSGVKDSIVATELYADSNGNVTYRIDLNTSNVNSFIYTGVANTSIKANPSKWTLHECHSTNKNMIGREVASGSMIGAAASQKFNVALSPSSSDITTYYLVLKKDNNAKFIGVGEIAFYVPTSGVATSSGIAASNEVNISVIGDGRVKAVGQGYGIVSPNTVKINGESSNTASKITNVEAYGIGVSGKGIDGKDITTKYCTVIAKGTKGGIVSSTNLTIDDSSTIDAVCNDNTGCGIQGNAEKILISPAASVYTAGKKGGKWGHSISHQPYSTLDDDEEVYEVQFHYATVSEPNSSIRNYGNDFFVTNIYETDKDYTTVKDNYDDIGADYVGVGHNDSASHYSLYIYLPENDYINVVEAYNKGSTESKFSVNYAVAGYNKVGNSGELLFTAKYDMGDYNNLNNSYITSAHVDEERIDVYPLKSFYLETYKIYLGTKGTELATYHRDQLKNASELNGIYDNDTNYTWSEVKYFIEKLAPAGTTVYVKVAKNSLAFSTITVPNGVKVEMYSDDNFKVVRAVFDTSLTMGDMDSMYEPAPSGKYPLEGKIGNTVLTMLESYQNIMDFYSPSTGAYTKASGYPTISGSNNGLALPLFHMVGNSELNIDTKVSLDNVSIGSNIKH